MIDMFKKKYISFGGFMTGLPNHLCVGFSHIWHLPNDFIKIHLNT